METTMKSDTSFPRLIAMIILAAATLALLLVPGCASSASYGPDEAADKISAHLVAGEKGDADDVFDDVKKSDSHRTTVYNALYARARDHFESENYIAAVALLGFLVDHYPNAMAVHEALVYAYLMGRSNSATKLKPEQVREMQRSISVLRKNEKNPPAYVDLAEAQALIDAGQLSKAREALTRFKSRWDGQPAALRDYLVELERYLSTHGG